MSQDKLPGSQKAPTLVMTMEAAKRYELRSFWVRRRRAGKQEAYSGRCVVCGRRSRVTLYPGAQPAEAPWDMSCPCGHIARFSRKVLPALPTSAAVMEPSTTRGRRR